MKKINQHKVERFILIFIFSWLTFLNLDFYFTALTVFFGLLILCSFFIKKPSSKNIKEFSYPFYIFILLYYGVLVFSIPDFFDQFYLFVYAPIGLLIVSSYFILCEDKSNELIIGVRSFNYTNIFAIFSVYSLVGFNQFLMAWMISLMLFNAIYRKIYLIKSFIFITLMATVLVLSNNTLNNIALMYFPDFDSDGSAIGSNMARVSLKNKVIFIGEGQLPDEPLFYNNQFSVLKDFNNQKIEWNDVSVRRVDYSLLNIVANIRNGMGPSTIVNPFPEKDYYNFYDDKDNYVRMQLSSQFKYFKFYYPDINKEPSLKHTQFIDFFENIQGDTSIEKLTFKSQFLRREAVPVKKVLTLNTPLNVISYMPPRVISIKSAPKNRTYYRVFGDSLAAISREKDYQNLEITYLDSIYVSYRNPVKEDRYISERYKKIIDMIAPEIGINDNDDIYTKENKIHEWLAKNFKYTLKLKYNGEPRTLEDFLLRDRRGHCEYFATATALISRYYGIPSQYVTGIVIDENGNKFSGNKKKGHAWNLFWDGAGWIKVDNTVSIFDNETPKWMSDISSNFNWGAIKNIFNSEDNKLSNTLLSMNKLILLSIILGAIFTGLAIYIFFIKIKNKNKDKILEKKLKKDLKMYLKKYPKEEHIPWKIWAISTGEEYCVQKVKEYYKKMYTK